MTEISGEKELSTSAGLVELLNKGEIDTQIATARRYPRSIKTFLTTATEMVTLTEGIAQECIYALPRDGKTIEGPSARFAEIAVSAWGNCRAGARVVDDKGDFVTAQGVFHDLERNVAITFEVQRRIIDKRGQRFNPDMIGVTGNAASSIALRNAVLKGIPKAFWGEIYNAARATVMGDAKTLVNRRAEAIAYLQKFGATQEMVCATLGVRGIEDIGLDELVTLRGLATAIKDGDTSVEQAFAPKEQIGKPEVKQPISKSQIKRKSAQSDTEKTEAERRGEEMKAGAEARQKEIDDVESRETEARRNAAEFFGEDVPQ